jgi:hypothetical protein
MLLRLIWQILELKTCPSTSSTVLPMNYEKLLILLKRELDIVLFILITYICIYIYVIDTKCKDRQN